MQMQDADLFPSDTCCRYAYDPLYRLASLFLAIGKALFNGPHNMVSSWSHRLQHLLSSYALCGGSLTQHVDPYRILDGDAGLRGMQSDLPRCAVSAHRDRTRKLRA